MTRPLGPCASEASGLPRCAADDPGHACGDCAPRTARTALVIAGHAEDLARAFAWLTRTGIGPRFGRGLAIGPYQQVQCAALDVIAARARAAVGPCPDGYAVRVTDRMVETRRAGSPRERWHAIGVVTAISREADHASRHPGGPSRWVAARADGATPAPDGDS